MFTLNKRSRRSIWLLSSTAVYLVLGAFIFSSFEYDNELNLRNEIRSKRRRMQLKYNFTQSDFRTLEKVVVQSIPYAAGLQWKFAGAFYFCTVVITTVGYGHSTPTTFAGKLFCMLFALIGIPLGLVTFQSVGERINCGIRYCLVKLGRFFSKYGYNYLKEVKPRHLLFVSFSVGTLTILIGTVVFHYREKWSLFDAYYYCVITLSTIGFGDYVPLQSNNRLEKDFGYVVFTLFFILFGLAIFSACVNLLILEFMTYNADIVTARTRIRRLLSLRGTPSFRNASFRGALPSYCRTRRRTLATPSKDTQPPISKKRSVSATELHANMETFCESVSISPNHLSVNGNIRHSKYVNQSLSNKSSSKDACDSNFDRNSERVRLLYMRDVQGYSFVKPIYFTAQRLPTRYIDHLVHTYAAPVQFRLTHRNTSSDCVIPD